MKEDILVPSMLEEDYNMKRLDSPTFSLFALPESGQFQEYASEERFPLKERFPSEERTDFCEVGNMNRSMAIDLKPDSPPALQSIWTLRTAESDQLSKKPADPVVALEDLDWLSQISPYDTTSPYFFEFMRNQTGQALPSGGLDMDNFMDHSTI